jgi:hypothetical protein
MKKALIGLVLVVVCAVAVYAGQLTLTIQDGTKTGGAGMIEKVNANFTEVYSGLTSNGAARLAAVEAIATNATVVATEIDAASAAALLVGKATATSVTIGATDANTTVAGDLTVSGGDVTVTGNGAKINMGTNGFFQVIGTDLVFVSSGGFTNTIVSDITQ